MLHHHHHYSPSWSVDWKGNESWVYDTCCRQLLCLCSHACHFSHKHLPFCAYFFSRLIWLFGNSDGSMVLASQASLFLFGSTYEICLCIVQQVSTRRQHRHLQDYVSYCSTYDHLMFLFQIMYVFSFSLASSTSIWVSPNVCHMNLWSQ